MTKAISIPSPSIDILEVSILGTSAHIQHAWSAKAKKEMLDKQMKKATGAKKAKDPEADYVAALYPPSTDGTSPYSIPSVAVKNAMVSAGRTLDLKMTMLRQMFHVKDEYVPLYGNPQPREDMVDRKSVV